MPEKTYGRCAHKNKRCIRCWTNKLYHGNPQAAKYVIKNDSDYNVKYSDKTEDPKSIYSYTVQCKSRGNLRHVILQINKINPFLTPINTAFLTHNGKIVDNLHKTIKFYDINDGDELIYQPNDHCMIKYEISFINN